MDILNTATNMFISKMGAYGSDMDAYRVKSGLASLLPMKAGDLDLESLLNALYKDEQLASLAITWLSDKKNATLKERQVMEIFGEAKLRDFVQYIKRDKSLIIASLARMLPDLLDSHSQGGHLIDFSKPSFGTRLKRLFS